MTAALSMSAAGDSLAIRVVSCDGKISTLTAPPGYNYVWFKTSDSLYKHMPHYWDSLPAEGTFRKDGSLKGKFSISPTRKVHFSQGNLEYHAYNRQFRFAREQWYTTYIPYGYKGQRDDNGWTPYIPWDSIHAWSGNLELQNSSLGQEWFLMTQEEWDYLLHIRKNAAKRWGYSVINDLRCLILLPDSWSLPAGLTFTPQDSTFANCYTLAQWRSMEKVGAVALPFVGYTDMSGSSIVDYNRHADYWFTNISANTNRAYAVRLTRLTDDTPRDSVPADPIPPFVQDSCITIDWNQMVNELVPNTTLIIDTLENEIRYTSTRETTVSNRVVYTKGFTAPPSHKVLVHARYKTNFTEKLYFRYFNGSDYKHITQNFTPNEWYEYTDIIDGYNHATSVWSSFLITKYHIGEYFSLPREGGIMIFDLTQMFGAGNEPTKEQFLSRFPDLNYPYTEGEFRQLCDFTVSDTLHICPHEAQPLAGTLTGLFSVSDSTQVQFSQGNLQYQPSSKTWRFASEQWETRGNDNNSLTTTSTKWMDLFAWGCSGYTKGIKWNNPIRRGKYPDHIANFFIADDPMQSMTGQYAEVDWGVHNAISNGGDRAGLWRTMTFKEWWYLFYERPNAAQRRAYVSIDGNKGLVFLPDDWTTPAGLTIITDNTGPNSTKVDSFFVDNNYTIAQWRQMEQAGAVFLPTTGICGTNGQYAPTSGFYWTTDPSGPDMCRCLHFNQKTYHYMADFGGCYRTHAIAVRLVIDKHKMDSLKAADNRFLRRYPSIQWNQLLHDMNYDHHLVHLDTLLPDERRYTVTKTEVTASPAVYASGTDAPYGHQVLVHIRFKSNFTETPYLHYSDGVNEGELYPVRYEPNEWCTIIGIIDGFEPGTVTGFLPSANGYHAGEYISLPKDGGFMVFDLTRMFGAGNEPNLDEFLRLFPQDNFPYDKGTERTMCDVAAQAQSDMQALTPSNQYNSTEGKLNGFFSVSSTKLVRFSKGNLQYQASTNTWRFAEHQYDIAGADNTSISATTDKWIDLFGWGTSGWSSGAICYQPWSTAQSDSCYYIGGNPTTSMTGDYRQADWGVYNAISNGGNRPGIWRVLTQAEMQYLLIGRPSAAQLKAVATVEGLQGIVLLPDEWSWPTGVVEDNSYTAAEWEILEQAGAVFLPSSDYWTSDVPEGSRIGGSARLVIDKETAEQAQNDYLHYDNGLLDNVDCPLAATNGRCKPTVEVGSNGVYTLTLDVTEGYPRADTLGSFRMNFPLYILEGYETDQFYLQFKYKRLQGNGDFSVFDWCDRTPVTILKKVTTENYTYLLLKLPILAQKTKDVQYSNVNRFLDVNSVFAGDVYRIWDIKLGANPWVDPMDLAEVKSFEPFATTGVFTVGEGKQMLFSSGNLQYQASTNTWRFAEQQYDAIGTRNRFIAPDYTGWIDLFGWGTSGYDLTPQSLTLRTCHPWSYDTIPYDTTYNPLYDWGVYNTIANGGNIRGLWRTPMEEEFVYMLQSRPNAATLKAYATINGSKGLIVLPDSCELPSGFPYVPASSNAQYTANTYTYAQWKVLERLGALFLPTTSDRYFRKVRGTDPPSIGYYRTANAPTSNDTTFIGQAVRLAADVLSTDSQLVVKADSSIWCCRLSSPDTTFILAARAIGRLNNYDFIEYDTICEGDTLKWHGQALSQAGVYIDSLLTIYGCDSVYTMHLTELNYRTFLPTYTDTVLLAWDATTWSDTISADKVLMAGFPTAIQQQCPTLKTKGAFRVNKQGNVVYFSSGNLQYKASSDTWRFAPEQYDVIGEDNANISSTYDGWIDLFGWATSGYNGQYPWLKSTNAYEYIAEGKDITGTNYDWGMYNTIDNYPAGTWRTMTNAEWSYIFQSRPNAALLRGHAIVNGVYGYIFLPDDWILPAGLHFIPGGANSYQTNVYTAAEWRVMEANGAVFFPANGYREGTRIVEFSEGNFGGHYHTSSIAPNDSLRTGLFGFHSTNASVTYGRNYTGISARPVHDILYDTIVYKRTYTLGDIVFPLPLVRDSFNHADVNYTVVYRDPENNMTLQVDLVLLFPKATYFTDTICEGTNYIWEHEQRIKSGIYKRTYHLKNGCDSVCFLDLTVLQNSYHTETAMIGIGETYTWRGQVFTQPIDTTDTLTNAVGCDSIVRLHLIAKNDLMLSYDATSWPQDSSAEWIVRGYPTSIGAPVMHTRFVVDNTGKQVSFSPGNLQYRASDNLWRFAPQQYHFCGIDNALMSGSCDRWIDLFCWATSGYDNMHPWMTSARSIDYAADYKDIAGTNYDWGVYNVIDGYPAGTWRTMTADEWNYIFLYRPNANALKAHATVSGIQGCMFLPDEWVLPEGLHFTPGTTTGYRTNIYTSTEWQRMEANGAVFLPAAGYRNVLKIEEINTGGHYMTSTIDHHNKNQHMDFRSHGSATSLYDVGSIVKYFGINVRLVHDAVYDTICAQDTYSWGPVTWQLPPVADYYNHADVPYTLEYRDPQTSSIVTIHLLVKFPGYTEEHVHLCDSLNYTWSDSTYWDSGIYTNYTTAANGCDSTAILYLDLCHHTDSTEIVTICAGESHTWQGQTFTESTTITDTIPNAVGCDSVCTLQLTVNPLIYEIFTHTQCADVPFVEFELQIKEGIIHQLQFAFSQKALNQHFRDTIVSYTNPIIQIPNRARAGIYDVAVTPIFGQHQSPTRNYQFTLLYPSSVLDQHWDDFIGVLTYPYNGGYDFVGFQWYKDGSPIAGETHSYLYQPLEMGSPYSAMLEEANGTKLMTCEIIATPQTEISLYPTLLQPNQIIYLHSSANGTIWLYDSLGKLLYATSFESGESQFAAPQGQGIYIVKIQQTGEQGKSETKKLIVR